MSIIDPSDWSADTLLEVDLKEPDDFSKAKESLTRIGFGFNKEKKLYQSCHILHKQGRYFIVHFKELILLDGNSATLTPEDISRRNRIASLLDEWGIVKLKDTNILANRCPMSDIKVLSHSDSKEWNLIPKYTFASKRPS